MENASFGVAMAHVPEERSMFMNLTDRGLRGRLIQQTTLLVMIVIAFGIGATALVLTKIISTQLEKSLETLGHEYLRDLDLHFTFMDQNIERFSKNQLVVNSLIDPKGREIYLPNLAKEFSLTAFVVDLAVVDFAGNQIYGSSDNITIPPNHIHLRKALATERRTIQLLEKNLQLRIIQPVVYYKTTQGAVVVTLDLGAMLRHTLAKDTTRTFKLYSGSTLLLTSNEHPELTYITTRHDHDDEASHPYVDKLALSLEIGVPQEEYRRPIRNAILGMLGLSLFFLALAALIGWRIGDQLARPILRLCEKVQQSGSSDKASPCSPVGTGDELETLALAFDERTAQLTAARDDLHQNNELLKLEVAQRQEAEASLQAAYDDLEEKILQRTRELHVAKASLDKGQEIAHLGNWNWDITGNTLWWSDEIYRIFGQDPQSFTASYEKLLKMIHPDDLELVETAISETLATHKPYSVEHRVVLPDGQDRYVLEQGELLVDSAGIPLQMVGTILDINDRKVAEQALRDSEEKFSKAFKNAPIMMSISDLMDGTMLEVNDCFLETMGFTKQELIGHSLIELGCYSKAYRDPMRDELLKTGSLYRKDLQFLKKNKQLIHCSYAGEIITIGGIRRLFSITEDITERKQMEMLLKQDEERLSSLLNLSQRSWESEEELITFALEEAVRLTDSKVGHIHFVNPEDNSIKMFAWSQMTKEECRSLKASHYPLESAGIWADSVRTGKPAIHNDYPGLLEKKGVPEGHFSIQRHMSVPIFDQDEVVAVVGVGNKENPYEEQDIRQLTLYINSMWQTLKRKRVEAQLSEAEERYRTLFDKSPDGIVLVDPDTGGHLAFNEAAHRQLGYEKDEFANLQINDYEASEYPEEQVQHIRQVQKDGLDVFETLHRSKNGEIRNVMVTSKILSIDGHQVILAIFRDFTLLKQAEEEVKLKAQLTDAANDSIFLHDLEGHIIEANEAAWKSHGYRSKDELLSCNIKDLDAPEWSKHFHFHAVEMVPQGSCMFEATHICKDGSRLPLDIAAKLIDVGGKRMVLSVARDIRARKTAEAKLQQFTEELERSNKELQQFAYVASHDLQEPLRKIMAFGDRLQRHGGPALDERSLDYLERMLNAAGRMRHLIAGLLEFSRVTTKGKPFETVALHDVVQEVLVDLEELIRESKGQIEIGELPLVTADRLQMRQLFQNLIVNGLRYQVVGQEPHITISSQEGVDSTWEIMVSDNGIGFDEKYLDRIFIPFQRLHARDEYEGTGMGLAICEKIVKRHNGRITARSSEGQGATFIVHLPSPLDPGARKHDQ